MALSLFGGKKHLHHFVEEQDVAREFFALLVEAKTMYLRDVVAGSKQYHRYVEDFVSSHGISTAIMRSAGTAMK